MVTLNSHSKVQHVHHLLTTHLRKKLKAVGIQQLNSRRHEKFLNTISTTANLSIDFDDETIRLAERVRVTTWGSELDYGYTVAAMDDIVDLFIAGKLEE